mgnify:CR=1
MNNQQRFELLSAYLDRELSPEEMEKVERWLSEDPTAQQAYQNLLQLRYCLREAPIPYSGTAPDLLSQKVATQANRRGFRERLVWSGSALGALVIMIITSVWTTDESPLPALVQSESVNSSSLMIVVNQPILEIPTIAETTAIDDENQ